MKPKKRLKQIEKINSNTGKKLYKKFKKEGGLKTAKVSIAAYNVAIKALKYRLIFRD